MSEALSDDSAGKVIEELVATPGLIYREIQEAAGFEYATVLREGLRRVIRVVNYTIGDDEICAARRQRQRTVIREGDGPPRILRGEAGRIGAAIKAYAAMILESEI
jgi:hypothetical protein